MPSSIKVPQVILVYGASGVGKSTVSGYYDPDALILAGKGAMTPILSLMKREPKRARDDAADVLSIQNAVRAEVKQRKVRTIIIDDWSLAVKNTIALLEVSDKTWTKYTTLNRMCFSPNPANMGLVPMCRELGITVIFNCHDKPPTGEDPIGGPALPGQLMEEIPRNVDAVLLMTAEASREPHAASLRASIRHYPTWRTKDRWDVAWENTPPNLEEMIRINFHVPWPEGLEWMEEYVEFIAQTVLRANQPVSMVRSQMIGGMWDWLAGTNIPPHLCSWILRNGFDRAEIRRHEMYKWQIKSGRPVMI